MSGQLSIVEAGPAPDPEFAQWFTRPELAASLVAMVASALRPRHELGRDVPPLVLEPSAGRGNLVRAVRTVSPSALISAVEIDPRWTVDLAAIADAVCLGDYLAQPAPAQPYDLIVSNPPFDGGEEVEHLAKMLDEALRIGVLLPARSLHGRARYERVWHRFDPRSPKRDWYLRGKTHCVARPAFGEKGGTDEIVLLDLSRAPGPCAVGWL